VISPATCSVKNKGPSPLRTDMGHSFVVFVGIQLIGFENLKYTELGQNLLGEMQHIFINWFVSKVKLCFLLNSSL